MAKLVSEYWTTLKLTVKEFVEDECPVMAGALSYYAIFSLPALLVMVILVAGFFLGRDRAEGHIETQIRILIGSQGANQIQEMIRAAGEKTTGSLIASLVGLIVLIFGATGFFVQLQRALNRAWEVKPDPSKGKGGVRNFLMKRLISFSMILVLAFLLLVSLAISAVLSALAEALQGSFGSGAMISAQTLNLIIAFGVTTLLFAAIFRIMPDADISWRNVWAGAIFTGFLFTIGKFAIGFYLGKSDVGSGYGAAGSLAIVLIWIYYSSMILLLGAEFTQVWSKRHGSLIRPSSGAVKVVREEHKVPKEEMDAKEERGGRAAQ